MIAIESAFLRGAERVGALLGREVSVGRLAQESLAPSAVQDRLGADEEIVVVLVGTTEVHGDEIALVFSPREADALARLLSGEGFDTEMGGSSVCESINVFASAFLSELAQVRGRRILPHPPVRCADLSGAVIGSLLAPYLAARGSEVQLFDAPLRVEGAEIRMQALLLGPSWKDARETARG